MTPEDFLDEVIESYCRSREPLHRHEKLCRGESRSVASETEDLLAYYLVNRIPSIERIFINQPMTTQIHPRIKPDLVICRRSQITALVDVKMDLGYKRDKFDETLRQTEARMTQLRGQVFNMGADNVHDRNRTVLPLAQNARYLFVIVSDRNVSPVIFRRFEECASSLSNTALHVLTRGCHPNENHWPKEKILAKLTICHQAFKDMENEIQRSISEPTAGVD